MLNIDELSLADIAQINVLLKQLSKNAPRISKKSLEKIARNGGYVFFRNQNEKEKIIGIATLIIYYSLRGRLARIEDVVVDESHREEGLGERLVLSLIKEARVLNADRVYLTSSPKRVAANTLYQKLGFVRRETNVYRLVFKKTEEKMRCFDRSL